MKRFCFMAALAGWVILGPGTLRGQEAAAPGGGQRITVEERFKSLDKNGDGVLTRDELPGPIFQRADANGDGKVTLEELKAFAATMRTRAGQGQRSAAAVEERFKQSDKNSDGVLTPDEMADNAELFKAMDANGDGKVTLEEARAFDAKMRRGAGGAGARPNPSQSQVVPPVAPTPVPVPADIKQELGIQYATVPGVDASLTSLDIYQPPAATNRPVMVYVHGGGWKAGDKSAVHALPLFFAQQGFVLVSVNYRLSPQSQHPAHVQDVAAALAWVHSHIKEHGGNPEAIYLMGHSAGAHLACLAAMNEKYLKAQGKDLAILKGVVLLDNPILTYDTLEQEIKRPNQYMLAAFGTDPAALKDLAPLEHLGKGNGIPPILFVTASKTGWDLPTVEAAARRVREQAGVRAEVVDARAFKNHATINDEFGLPGDAPTAAALGFLQSLQPGAPAVASLGGTQVLQAPQQGQASAGLLVPSAVTPQAPPPAAAAGQAPAAGQASANPQQARLQQMRNDLLAADRNGDGQISREEAPQWLKPFFDQIDTNHDGQLTLDELRAGMQQMMRQRRMQMQGPAGAGLPGAPGAQGTRKRAGARGRQGAGTQ